MNFYVGESILFLIKGYIYRKKLSILLLTSLIEHQNG